jgi:hypothetical protein
MLGFTKLQRGSTLLCTTLANHLHRVESDIPEGSIVCLGCFFKDMVYERKQWGVTIGAKGTRRFRGGGPCIVGWVLMWVLGGDAGCTI